MGEHTLLVPPYNLIFGTSTVLLLAFAQFGIFDEDAEELKHRTAERERV